METNNLRSSICRIDMNDAVSAKESDWVRACADAANNDEFYRIFRSSKPFRRVIEGSPRSCGLWNLKRLLKEADFLKALPLIQASDTVGLPLHMIDFNAHSPYEAGYSLSPTTIRYANNAFNCLSLFGKNILNGETEIHDIGAGYGGECKIFNDIAVTLFNSDLGKKWHIYDLPSSHGIIKRFLLHFGYSARFESVNSLAPRQGSGGLVISNGAFSEMRGSLLDAYFNSVIVPSKYGYFITNFESHSAPYGGWTTREFVRRLRSCGKTDVKIVSSDEYLSHFDRQAGSRLVVFGQRHIRKNNVHSKDIVKIRLISMFEGIIEAFVKSFIKR